MNDEKQSLSLWIEQHLEEREIRLQPNNPFVWHQPSANDLLPSDYILPINLDDTIEFTKD